MRNALSRNLRSKAAMTMVAAAIQSAACGDPRELVAPEGTRSGAPSASAQDEIVTYPSRALADYPVTLRFGGAEDAGTTYEWTFSDGTRASGARVTKSFVDSGVTTVRVRVTDATGHVRKVFRDVRVGPSIAALAQVLTGINPGGLHSCAIDVVQTLSCWGYNGNGTVGDGTTIHRTSPVAIGGGVSFSQVATGYAHSCALTTEGAAYCWGRNSSGELGDGTFTDRQTPTPVAGGLLYSSIDVGYNHSCGITASGTAHCWGGDAVGQLGDGQAVTASNVPVAVAGGRSFSMVRAGYFHSCAIESVTGLGYCWGSNWMGQLGAGSTADFLSSPAAVAGGNVFTQLDAGGYHTCGITDTRTFCWGWNGKGQIGVSTNDTCSIAQPCARVPVRLNGSLRFVGVTVGISHSCGVEAAGDVHCWGSNSAGELGDGTTTDQPLARRVHVPIGLKTVLAGGAFTCGVGLDNRAYCWGSNRNGKLGLGDTVDRLVPTVLPDLAF